MTETTIFNVPRGTAYITAQQVIIYATSFLYYILLFRILNLSQIGMVSLLAAAMSIFTTLTQLALPAAATRFISANLGTQDSSDAGAVAKTSLRLTLTLAIPAFLLAVSASPWIGSVVFKSSDAASLLMVTFVASLLLDLTTLYGAYFLGLGLYAEMVYQNILYVPLSRGLGLILVYRGLGPLGIPTGWALGAFATLLLSLYLWRGRLTQASAYPVRPLLAFSLPVFATAVITLLQGWGDITLLQALLGQLQTTGAYYLIVSSVGFLSILWTPAAGALYPALSSTYTSQGPEAVSAKLAVAIRLVNLTVLPAGAALAAVAPTALEAVYGKGLALEALPFALLTVTIIFSAQSLLLIITLQAIGDTKPLLPIYLAATILDMATVGLAAQALGTTAGAIGRALLAVSTLILAWRSLRPVLSVPITTGLSRAVALAFSSSIPLAVTDRILILTFSLSAVLRVLVLLGVFAFGFLVASRTLSVFKEDDFDILETALPRFLRSPLRILERLLVQTDRPISQVTL